MSIVICPAQAIDAAALTEIRISAKGYWGYSTAVLESWRPAMQITADYIRNNWVYTIDRDGQRVGFYALTRNEPHELDHLWLHPCAIGQGIGRQAWQHALATARAQNIASLRIVSDADAVGFYLHLGAVRIGELFSAVQNRMLPVLEFVI